MIAVQLGGVSGAPAARRAARRRGACVNRLIGGPQSCACAWALAVCGHVQQVLLGCACHHVEGSSATTAGGIGFRVMRCELGCERSPVVAAALTPPGGLQSALHPPQPYI